MPEAQTAPAPTQPEFNQATQDAAVATAITAERARVTALTELDAESNVSAALAAAIGDGSSAGDFAIGLQKAARQQGADALANAKGDAVDPAALPQQRTDKGANTTVPNRGEAAVTRMRGKHKGLPAQA